MSPLESALRELQIASAELTEIGIDKPDQAHAALDRRSRAISAFTELTATLPLNSAERDDILAALRPVCDAGTAAQQRIAALGRTAVDELNKWTGIYRALGGSGAGCRRIDITG